MGKQLNPPTPSQSQYTDDQTILDVDFDSLYNIFILPIDALRSRNNPAQQSLNTPNYQESRLSTYYRMIGFPIVASNGNFYSSGFDPNLNTDINSQNTNNQTAANIIADKNLINQFAARESIPTDFRQIFAAGGNNAQAIMLGSLFVRELDKSLSGTPPLTDDPAKIQNIQERVSEVLKYFPNIPTNILISNHQLKPFIVDPRVDSNIRPIVNKICAPFLKDKTQTKVFTSNQGSANNLKRPFIEKVISIVFNNNNNTTSSEYINKLKTQIANDENVSDQSLLNATNNTLATLNNSQLMMFNKYYRLLRIVVEKLLYSIRELEKIRQSINFQPIPDPKNGVESGTNGGMLQSVVGLDPNNTRVELDIVYSTRLQALDDIDFNTGLQGIPDPGDFTFSNLDDIIGNTSQNIEKSYAEHLSILNDNRNYLGNQGIDHLRNIEIIMGEFSGLGLIDIIAIQAALWVMSNNSLLGLIDQRAFQRISYRPDINLNGATQNNITSSLTEFEKQLQNIYLLVQLYFNNLSNGSAYSI